MSVSTINNNIAQLYTQEKPATAITAAQTKQAATTAPVSAGDVVQISEQAKALLQQEKEVSLMGNGGGIIPPGKAPIQTQGNGGGIIPPGNAPIQTQGNGGGIIPPGNAPIQTQGNGGGIIPPGK